MKQTLARKIAQIDESLQRSSITYGQFVMFIAVFDPNVASVEIAKEDETVETLASLNARLRHYINFPERFWGLHLCGNGFGTFSCDNWRHL